MITGAHAIIYSKNPEADRNFLKNVLKLSHIDAGGGWLIFELPPTELAVHPSDKNNRHEFYFICDDIQGFRAEMEQSNIDCSEVKDEGWGLLLNITLPGGGELGIYEVRHPQP